MEQSLSIILTVHNAQRTLVNQVQRLLEVAADLTSEFEILIVDDGSEDRTEELAHELHLKYPQVRSVRHPRQLGVAESIRTGLRRTAGDVLFVQDDEGTVSPSDVRRLWRMRDDHDLLLARPQGPQPLSRDLIARLAAWGTRMRQPIGAIQMIRRRAAEQSPQQLDSELLRQEQEEAERRLNRFVRSPKFISRLEPQAVESA